ncbi:MAG: carboxy-S-adenosyl-L-methionine synthase CmoA [Gammaproteobacteria bacterium]|nr:carboxy-S-adenosyl-L-methionine synthase CmoA [Gammaproteobacteria bacterium]
MSTKQRPDRIYRQPRESVRDFTFDRNVALAFQDMIDRSVPGYATVIDMISVLASTYVQPDSLCYDLGCSLGASSMAMRRGISVSGCTIVAVDNAWDMLNEAQRYLKKNKEGTPIELVCSDLLDIAVCDASMVVMNFTLQFVTPTRRIQVLQSIHDGLRPQGILVLSEKIAFSDAEQESMQIDMHHAFKRANGYNDLEISQKRAALERVMIPETLEQHRMRLRQVGFERIHVWFQCFNFVSIVASR